MNKSWKIALSNLRRNKRRNSVCIISIAFGLVGLMLLGSYVNHTLNFLRVYTIYTLKTGHLSIYPKDGFQNFIFKPNQFSFSLEQQNKIETLLSLQQNQIELFTRNLSGTGLVGNGCQSYPFVATSIEPKKEFTLATHQQLKQWAPNLLQKLSQHNIWEYENSSFTPLSLSKGLANILNKPKTYAELGSHSNTPQVLNCSDPHIKNLIAQDANIQLLTGTWSGSLSALDGEIVSHFSTGFTSTDQGAISAPLPYLQNLFDTDHISHYSIWLLHPQNMKFFITAFKKKIQQLPFPVDLIPWDNAELSPLYNGGLHFMEVLIIFVSLVLASIISLSIMNANTITITERSQEIGMMKALGFTTHQIRQLFLQESLCISVIGLMVGFFITLVFVLSINLQEIHYTPFGAATEITLQLIPHWPFSLWVALGILLLNSFISYWIVGKVAKKNITHLIYNYHG